jgi:hypothetical protein
MSEDEKQQLKAYVEHWRRVGPKLEAIRRQELRRYDFEANRHIVDSLLQMGLQHAVPRTTSGLVELERKLKRHYERAV